MNNPNGVRRDRGFSMIEVTIVAAVFVIGSAAALVQLRATRDILEADAVSNMVVSQLRYARQVAIDQRRNVQIEFLAPNRIRVTRFEPGGTSTVISNVILTSGFTYVLPGPTVPDTPEGFGNATAVSFSGGTGGVFLGDGTFVTAAGLVLNGTVFTGGGIGPGSSRAVTVTGATGRIKQYWLTSGAWEESTR